MCGACRRPICGECLQVASGRAVCQECAAAQSQAAAPPFAGMSGAPAAGLGAAAGAAAAVAAPTAPWLVSPPPQPTATAFSAEEAPPASEWTEAEEVPLGTRLLRGLAWGSVYGQWWTLWTIVCGFLWGHSHTLVETVGYAVFYGLMGSVTGLIIGATDANASTGPGIGIGVGLVACLVEMAVSHSPFMLFNLVWYFFTGRFIGRGITARLQRG
jgi:hypothetical protein